MSDLDDWNDIKQAQLNRSLASWTGRYIVDPNAPSLTEDGSPTLGFVYDGVLYVHPDRLDVLEEAIRIYADECKRTVTPAPREPLHTEGPFR